MEKHDGEAVAKALDIAWREHREWFPTLGQVMEIVDMLEKSKMIGESMRLTEGEAFNDPDAAQKIKGIIDNLSGGEGIN